MYIDTRNIPRNLTPEFHPAPCPHCGKGAIMRQEYLPGVGTVHVTGCSDPNCIGSGASASISKVLSLRAWNRRSAPRPGSDWWNTPEPKPAAPAPVQCNCSYCKPPTPPKRVCACCGRELAR